ncbi:MAG: hypothetical protein WA118_01990 [Carboxydocellales bacterium]
MDPIKEPKPAGKATIEAVTGINIRFRPAKIRGIYAGIWLNQVKAMLYRLLQLENYPDQRNN